MYSKVHVTIPMSFTEITCTNIYPTNRNSIMKIRVQKLLHRTELITGTILENPLSSEAIFFYGL